MSYSRTKKFRALHLRGRSESSDESNASTNNVISDSSKSISMDISRNSSTDDSSAAVEAHNNDATVSVSAPNRNETSNLPSNISGDMDISHNNSQCSNRSFSNVHLSDASCESESDSDSQFMQSSEASDVPGYPALSSSSEDLRNLRDKLRDCAVKHAKHITHSFLNDLLSILRSEGHTDLPKTAETLLRTERTRGRIQPMLSKKNTYGTYIYIGIENHLRLQISNSGFEDRVIKVLVNADGLPIYNHSKQQFWPILMQILHKDYFCKPFVVAIYCGNSKPHSADIFLNDFVVECTKLIEQGLEIDNDRFTFEISAFVCDTPARAFVKCCKGHTAFYGCERCTVRGATINQRRVYSDMNCSLRTKASFEEKRQPEHHIPDTTTPLIRIPGFDPVKQVVLDYMHLLCCGVEKGLFDKWFSTKKQKGKLGRRDRSILSEYLLALKPHIPMEFQRKVFDTADIGNWKATQYRFVLLYVGGIILRQVLSREMYRHYLLLFVASRILCSRNWALLYADRAESFLRDFFNQMPTFYGKDSQVMNVHNLIHVTDDVRQLQVPLTEYSSFPFENLLGHIKKLIRTPRNPVAQVFRRLSETDSSSQAIQKYHVRIANCRNIIRENITHLGTNYVEYTTINIKTTTISTSAPDNVVKLRNNEIFELTRILCAKDDSTKILIEGKAVKQNGDAFTDPMSSSLIGIYKIGIPFGAKKMYSTLDIAEKCLIFDVEERTYAVTLLHCE